MECVIRVKIYGMNLARIINGLVNKGVFLSDVLIKEKYVIFSLKEKDKSVLDRICKIERKRYRVIHKSRLQNLIYKLTYCFGSVIALSIVLMYMLSYNFFIFKVNIINDSFDVYDLSRVKVVLANNGIVSGISRWKYSSREIENVLLTNLQDIQGCSVDFDGAYLNVKIYPSKKNYENKSIDLISRYDGVVTSVDVYSGMANCRVGDVVKVGDVLIKSDEDANGLIFGKVYFSATKIYNRNIQKQIFTGRYELFRNFYLFNKSLINGQNRCTFANYLIKKCDFYINDNFILPIKCESIYCFEYDIVEEVVEFEKVENSIKKELYDEVMKKIPHGSAIYNTYYSIVTEGDFTRVDCYVESVVSLI